jgi:hypothetical protein
VSRVLCSPARLEGLGFFAARRHSANCLQHDCRKKKRPGRSRAFSKIRPREGNQYSKQKGGHEGRPNSPTCQTSHVPVKVNISLSQRLSSECKFEERFHPEAKRNGVVILSPVSGRSLPAGRQGSVSPFTLRATSNVFVFRIMILRCVTTNYVAPPLRMTIYI